ncbi:hypothetical protein J4216_01990 [Candidatus Woesearchaeota archaeon]|nr:hypothetical protein [Candidatus Woesearchaeota archaeon]
MLKKSFFIIILFFICSFSVNALEGAPENDATFYLDTYSNTHSVGFRDFPGEELGLASGNTGFFISNGQIITQLSQNHSWGNCDHPPQRVCKTERKLTSSYKDGHLEMVLRSDTEVIYNGDPIWPSEKPVVPGKINLFSELKLEGDFDDTTLSRFQGKATRKSSTTSDWQCAKWEDNDVGGNCELDRYIAEPIETESYKWSGFIKAPNPKGGIAVLSEVKGDVEIKRANSQNSIPAKVGDIIKKGDFILTGFESEAAIDFGYSKLEIYQLTHFRIDEFTEKDKIAKTQLYLRVGTIKPILKYKASIRGDFSVTTPTSISSIRGSEMIVVYNNETNKTDIFVTEDKAYVKGLNDDVEIEIEEGKKTSVDQSGKSSKIESFSSSEIPKSLTKNSQKTYEDSKTQKKGSSLKYILIIIGIIIILILFFIFKNKKKKNKK